MSVGIGFALKDVLENFVAGIILILQRPFVVGDAVNMGEVEGMVEDVRVRDTVVRLYDGRKAFVPNADIFRTTLINNTVDLRRLDFELGIGYPEDVPHAMRAAVEALKGVEGVLEDPSPMAVVGGLGDSAVRLRVYFWVAPHRVNILEVKSEAIRAVKERLDREGIEIPYPILTVNAPSRETSSPGEARGGRQGEGGP
jgi:small-conductance mechanosensitive channel